MLISTQRCAYQHTARNLPEYHFGGLLLARLKNIDHYHQSTTHMAILVIVCRCYSTVCPCCMFISFPMGPRGVRGLPSYPPHHWCAPQCANAVNQRDSKWKIMIMQLIMHWNNESIYRCTILIREKEGWNQTVNNALSAERHRLTASPSYYYRSYAIHDVIFCNTYTLE
jgi:hypothetical protein